MMIIGKSQAAVKGVWTPWLSDLRGKPNSPSRSSWRNPFNIGNAMIIE
jgi:hypothetical protein